MASDADRTAADRDGGRDARDNPERVQGAAIVTRLAAGELARGRVASARALLLAAAAMLDADPGENR